MESFGDEAHDPYFNGIMVELQNMPASNVLESIELRIALEEDDEWIVHQEAGRALVTSFTEGAFPCLKRVNIDVPSVGYMKVTGGIPLRRTLSHCLIQYQRHILRLLMPSVFVAHGSSFDIPSSSTRLVKDSACWCNYGPKVVRFASQPCDGVTYTYIALHPLHLAIIAMALPLELLFRVCAILEEDGDKETLKCCALVCSQFVDCCQSYIFAHVKLTLLKSSSSDVAVLGPAERLRTILERRPELGARVRSLELYFDATSSFSNLALPFILSKCAAVTAFAMETKRCDYPFTWPNSFPKSTQLAVESIVASPVLVELTIRGFFLNIPTFVSHCHPNLSSLVIRCRDIGTRLSRYTPLFGRPIYLRYFTATPKIILGVLNVKGQGGQPTFDLCLLEELDARFQESEYMDNLGLVLQHTASLERLTLYLICKHCSYLYSSLLTLVRSTPFGRT